MQPHLSKLLRRTRDLVTVNNLCEPGSLLMIATASVPIVRFVFHPPGVALATTHRSRDSKATGGEGVVNFRAVPTNHSSALGFPWCCCLVICRLEYCIELSLRGFPWICFLLSLANRFLICMRPPKHSERYIIGIRKIPWLAPHVQTFHHNSLPLTTTQSSIAFDKNRYRGVQPYMMVKASVYNTLIIRAIGSQMTLACCGC